MWNYFVRNLGFCNMYLCCLGPPKVKKNKIKLNTNPKRHFKPFHINNEWNKYFIKMLYAFVWCYWKASGFRSPGRHQNWFQAGKKAHQLFGDCPYKYLHIFLYFVNDWWPWSIFTKKLFKDLGCKLFIQSIRKIVLISLSMIRGDNLYQLILTCCIHLCVGCPFLSLFSTTRPRIELTTARELDIF